MFKNLKTKLQCLRGRVGEKHPPPPTILLQNNHKIKSLYIFIVTMDYVDKSDV